MGKKPNPGDMPRGSNRGIPVGVGMAAGGRIAAGRVWRVSGDKDRRDGADNELRLDDLCLLLLVTSPDMLRTEIPI